tara:strand:- start:1089 stop:1427 length:339 start_codon:yes stop_codon:yes gene_type:complete
MTQVPFMVLPILRKRWRSTAYLLGVKFPLLAPLIFIQEKLSERIPIDRWNSLKSCGNTEPKRKQLLPFDVKIDVKRKRCAGIGNRSGSAYLLQEVFVFLMKILRDNISCLLE